MSGLKRPSGAGPRLWLATWLPLDTSKSPTPMTLWATAGTFTVFPPGPLLPFAAMMTAPASNALSAATEIAPESLPLPCISATMTRSRTRTALSKPRMAAAQLRKPLQAPAASSSSGRP